MPNNFILSIYKLFNKELKFYKHNLVSESDFDFLINNMCQVMRENNDEKAHILASTNTAIAYKVGNEVYFIPAKIKAVINNGDNQLLTYYDYPCEMRREDLVEL